MHVHEDMYGMVLAWHERMLCNNNYHEFILCDVVGWCSDIIGTALTSVPSILFLRVALKLLCVWL